MIRNRWKLGDYLVQDDLSGFVRYRSDMVERYDGILMERRGNEDEIQRHPQEFVRALNDPQALRDIRPVVPSSAINVIDTNVVQGVTLPRGAATHLFPNPETGIGKMIVGGELSAQRFVVR